MQEWTAWMANKLDEHIAVLERMKLPEYVRYLEDHRRFYRMHFLGGILRGMGSPIGFTILGAALVLALLTRLFLSAQPDALTFMASGLVSVAAAFAALDADIPSSI